MRSQIASYTRGTLAKTTNVNLATIRYYERQELLTLPEKNSSGYYIYQNSDVARIFFIRRAQALGFTLKEIKTLLGLSVTAGRSCAEVQFQTEEKLVSVKSKITDLTKIQKSLEKLVDACKNRKTTSECPIVDSLYEKKPFN